MINIGPTQNPENETQFLFDLPVNTDILFSNHKGLYKKRIERRQTKLIKDIGFIKPFLWPGEQILLVTTGCSPMSFMEQFFTGWIIYYLKRACFIFTNMRIFHVPLKTGMSSRIAYRDSIAQILYADCEFIKQSGHTLVVRYKNGKKE